MDAASYFDDRGISMSSLSARLGDLLMSEQVIERAKLVNKGRRLEYFTIAYNSLEGLIAVVDGLMDGSIALVGFGFDSLIEVTSGAALVWRLHSDADESRRERIERTTLRIVGVCFLLLAAYVSYDSIKSLIWREEPRESRCGGLAIVPVLPPKPRSFCSADRAVVAAPRCFAQLVKTPSECWHHELSFLVSSVGENVVWVDNAIVKSLEETRDG